MCFTSQLEQLEEIHKSEDSELEQMKEEFTKRISDSETKLQSAAKVIRAEDRRGFENRDYHIDHDHSSWHKMYAIYYYKIKFTIIMAS